MDETNSWIVGSVALAVASTLSDPPPLDNLNIIALHRHCGHWLNFFVNVRGFRMIQDTPSSGAYELAGRRYFKFLHPHIPFLTITLTTACDKVHLGHLFFAAPNTDQQIAISTYRIISPYVGATASQDHIAGLRPSNIMGPAKKLHTSPGRQHSIHRRRT
ncbi:hypothetical protein B0H15DRAFT_956865 [Mycena belliarum]|uniref:Uncharacterized protein n=1 Tax=Mycena belliarum TaxID=1033014 RepID=A0AAD6XJ48_9AGAR|nr:hypothetical protein B0H15DRAFT_956865 [Mycena belliae]